MFKTTAGKRMFAKEMFLEWCIKNKASFRDIRGNRQLREVVNIRRAAIKFLWYECGCTGPTIAWVVNKDHTAVYDALGRTNRGKKCGIVRFKA
jgi:chromosomal replication initiation ATPase DnaA